MTDLDPAVVADAVRAVSGVADLSTGPTDQFRSYLPGGHTIAGVRADDDMVRINVIALFDTPLPALGDDIRAAVAPLVGGRDIVVAVDDLADQDDERADAE